MFDWAMKHGYLRTLDWRDYDLANAVLELPTVSPEQINEMYKIAHREFFMRPSYLIARLFKMRSLEDIKMNYRALRSIMFVRSTVAIPEVVKKKSQGLSPAKPASAPALQPSGAC